MDTDRKIAIGIAAALLVGFSGIALLSWMSGAGEQQETAAVAPVSRAERVAPAARVEPVAAQPVAVAPEPGPASAGTPEEAETFQVEPGVNYLARGIEAYRARNLEHAVAYLIADTEENPDRPYSQYLLGLSLWKSGRLDEAAEAMRRSAELDGSALKTFINLSRIENDRGDFDAALQAAWAARDLDPESAKALFLEGRSLHNLGEPDKAIEALRHSLEIDPDDGYAWNLLGLTHLLEEDDEAALQPLQRAAGLQPDVAYIQNNLGMALERNGRPAEAAFAYGRAVELDAGHSRAVANLARLGPIVPVPVAPDEVGVEVARDSVEPPPEEPAVDPGDGI